LKNKRLFLFLAIIGMPLLYACLLAILGILPGFLIYDQKSSIILDVIRVITLCVGMIFMIYGTRNVHVVLRTLCIIAYAIYLIVGIFVFLTIFIMCNMGHCI